MVARFHQKGFMRVLSGKLLISVLFLAIISPIWGTVYAAQGKSKAKKTRESQALAPVNGIFSMSTATNTLSADEIVEVTGTYSLVLTFNLPEVSGYQHNLILGLGYTAAYTHAMEGDRGGDLTDPFFNYGVVLGDRGIFKVIRVGIGGLIPVNKETRNTSMQAALGPNLSYNFDLGKVLWIQRWGYRHAWHEYDTEPMGKMNFPSTVNFSNIIAWNVHKRWALGVQGNYSYAVDYNDVEKSSTEFGANVSWIISKNFMATLGVLTRSGTLAPTGDFHRLNFYDPNRALAYLDLNLMF